MRSLRAALSPVVTAWRALPVPGLPGLPGLSERVRSLRGASGRALPSRALTVSAATVLLLVVATTLASGVAVASSAPARAAGGTFARLTRENASLAASSCPAPGGSTVPNASVTVPTTSGAGSIVVRGHGWGHGMGMSQYGAQGAALLGCAHETILRTYYQGTSIATRSLTGPVLLQLAEKITRTRVTTTTSTVTWQNAAGETAVQPVSSTWTVKVVAGRTQVADAQGAVQLATDAATLLSVRHGGKTVKIKAYTKGATSPKTSIGLRRGTLRFQGAAGSGRYTVREKITSSAAGTAVDKYLWGLGEVPVSWPVEALKAQADAARTYLTHSWSSARGAYVIGITTAAQVYRGTSREDTDAAHGRRWRSAVDETAGEVIVDGSGSAVTAMYSSSHGGWEQSRAYVYGSQGGYGYLSAVDDSTWDLASTNPYRSWAKAWTAGAFAAKFGFSSLTAVSLGKQGTAARGRGLIITGVDGGATVTRSYTGAKVRSTLGLRSPVIAVSWVKDAATVTPRVVAGDFDGDGTAETATVTGRTAREHLADGTTRTVRLPAVGTPVVGDFAGTGRDTIGVFRRGVWYLRKGSGTAYSKVAFGRAGDRPVVGRWGATTRDGIGVVRAGRWLLRRTPTAGRAWRSFAFGRRTDAVLAADAGGTGVDRPVLARHVGSHTVFIYARSLKSTTASTRVTFGPASGTPLVVDWDGTGGDTPGVWRTSTSTLSWTNSLTDPRIAGTVTLS